jgi:F-type H+-transporting ATPase subunit alpha
MKQKQYAPLSVAQMAASLYAVEKGYIDKVPADKVLAWEAGLHQAVAGNKALVDKLNTGDWSDAIEAELKAVMETFVKQSAI